MFVDRLPVKPIITVLLTICFLLLPHALMTADEATIKTLETARFFAFGGVGVAGTTSPGEVAFREILESKSAEEQFVTALKNGNAVAQCYALVGLKLKNRAEFDKKVKAFTRSKTEVETASGCMIMRLPMSSVVTGIRAGNYDKQAQREIGPQR